MSDSVFKYLVLILLTVCFVFSIISAVYAIKAKQEAELAYYVSETGLNVATDARKTIENIEKNLNEKDRIERMLNQYNQSNPMLNIPPGLPNTHSD